MLDVILYDRRIHDAEQLTFLLMRSRIAQERGVLHLLFVHDTLSIQVYQKVRLQHDIRNALGHFIQTHDTGGLLDPHRHPVCSCFPRHLNAVARIAGNGKVKHILAKGVSGLFFDEFRIISAAAGADDGSLAGDLQFFSFFIHRQNAADFSFFILQDLLSGRFHQELNAQFLGSCIKCQVHLGSRPGADAVAFFHDMPGGFGLGKVPISPFKFHAHIFQPLNGLCGLLKVAFYQTAVDIVMSVLHDHPVCLLDGQVDHLPLLDVGFDSQRSHAHIGGTAYYIIFLDQNNICTLLCCLHCCRQSGRTSCDHNDLSFIICHNSFPSFYNYFNCLYDTSFRH